MTRSLRAEVPGRHFHRADTGPALAQGWHLQWAVICTGPTFVPDLHFCSAITCTGPSFAQGWHRASICTGPTQASICTGLTQGQHLHRAGICTGPAFAVGHYMHRAFICAGPSFVQGHHLCRAFICTGPSFAKTIWRPPEGLESVSFINHHKHSPSLNGNLSSWIRQASSNHQTTSRSFIWIAYTGQII